MHYHRWLSPVVWSPGTSDQDWREEGGAEGRGWGRLFAVEVDVNREGQSWGPHREVLDDREASAQEILTSKMVLRPLVWHVHLCQLLLFEQKEGRGMTGVRGREGRTAEEQEQSDGMHEVPEHGGLTSILVCWYNPLGK